MDQEEIKQALTELATHLAAVRKNILRNWQNSVESDPELTTSSSLTRAQFNDHIPQVLDAFERRLQARDPVEKDVAFEDQKSSAAGHGLHRWQQGYKQRETIREWGHLHYWILHEIEDYGHAHPQLQAEVMPIARRALVRLCGEGVTESAASYEQLQRTEAAGRVRDLELALVHLRDLERQRAETWREAAHDLRGSVGVVSNASLILSKEAERDPQRAPTSRLLARSVASLRTLLTELIDLARLEAGEERRNVVRFDAAQVLREFCENLQPLATRHNLFLRCDGPAALPVEGDSIKVLRIVQNLVLNAFSVTAEGGVQLLWEARGDPQGGQWLLSVQDTGPGFQRNAPPLEHALREATQEAHDVAPDSKPAPTLKSRGPAGGTPSAAHEGIGLSIVKRLCELLDASLELETTPGAGTTFRVVFPRTYPGAAPRP